MTTRELRARDMAVPLPAHIGGRPDQEGLSQQLAAAATHQAGHWDTAGEMRSWEVARPAVCHYFAYRTEGCLTVGVYQCLHFTCREPSVSLGCPA